MGKSSYRKVGRECSCLGKCIIKIKSNQMVANQKEIIYNKYREFLRSWRNNDETGAAYHDLADAYVIFICDYDPFGKGLYRYSWDMSCRKIQELELDDGRHTIMLNTKGTNDKDVPDALVKFLKYVGTNLEKSMQDYNDSYIRKLQNSVANIKENRGMEAKYMLWKELLQDERKEGREEGLKEGLNVTVSIIIEMLSDIEAEIPDELRDALQDIDDTEILKECSRKARSVSTIEEFQEWLKSIWGK